VSGLCRLLGLGEHRVPDSSATDHQRGVDLDNLAKPTLDAMEGICGLRPVRGKMVLQPADDRADYL
jgi:hypothetical protein